MKLTKPSVKNLKQNLKAVAAVPGKILKKMKQDTENEKLRLKTKGLTSGKDVQIFQGEDVNAGSDVYSIPLKRGQIDMGAPAKRKQFRPQSQGYVEKKTSDGYMRIKKN